MTNTFQSCHLLRFSANSENELTAKTANLLNRLKRGSGLFDIASDPGMRKPNDSHRRMLVCKDVEDAVNEFESFTTTGSSKRIVTGIRKFTDRAATFMFSGVGDHYVDMGLGLYRGEPVFRETLDRCAELLGPIIDEDIKRIMFVEKGKDSASVGQPVDMRKMLNRDSNDEADKKLHQNTMIHPIMIALEYALASIYLDKGIKLQSMIGYSLGEYTAACLSGVLSLKDVLTLVSHRSRLIDRLPEGGMIAVMSSVEDVIPLLNPDIFLAIASGPLHSVISGDPGALSQLERQLTEKNIAYVRLPNSHAIHTTTAQSIGGDLVDSLQSIQLNPPMISDRSNVTGN